METEFDRQMDIASPPSLNRTMQYGNEEAPEYQISAVARFKSYYVVWKLFFVLIDERGERSLNRTMQYGNTFITKNVECSWWFKSYYVVWKRLYNLIAFGNLRCLNRTMQYGNTIARDVNSRYLYV